ncbi:MAG: hypothetical protein MJ177_09060 [Clostridia bacterium]|nr:hypothetical protein [Clostridia bacterium]
MTDSQTDWKKIGREYINSDIGYKELSEKYGLTVSEVSKKGAMERWVEKRREKREKKKEKKRAAGDRKLTDLKKAADTAGFVANSIADDTRKKIKEAKVNGEEMPVSINDLKSFSVALKNLVGVTRDVYDIPTAAQLQKQLIDRMKLENADNAGMPSLIITGAEDEEVEEWSE